MADNVNSTTGHELEAINVQDSKAQFQKFKDEVVQVGYKPNVHAGLADNLFGETQTNDVFTFRPTAGIQDVESGDAPVGGGTIKKVEGNGVAWNQFSYLKSYDKYGVVLTPDASGAKATISGIPSSGGNLFLNIGGSSAAGHKIYLSYKVNGVADGSGDALYDISNVIPAGGYGGSRTLIYEATNATAYIIIRAQNSQDYTFSFNTIDLTLMFGAGNEPSTVAEFEQWLANNVGLKSYYPYNEGELIPVKDFTVKSVGFNLWDEQWEQGILTGEGVIYPGDRIVSSNLIPVISGKTYHFRVGANDAFAGRYDMYDSNGMVVKHSQSSYGELTIPQGVSFIRFCTNSDYGTTYNHDICINLSYDGDRDGEYEEHWEREVGVDVTKVYGKLNGTGDSVQVFPDGLKAAGSVKDEIVRSGDVVKAIKRVGVADLGMLDWTIYETNIFRGTIENLKQEANNKNFVCSKYTTEGSRGNDKTIARLNIYAADNNLYVTDTSHSTAPTSSDNWLSGVMLYYELATPEEYILDEDILPIQYRVDNYGTEEVLLGNDEGLVSCSPKMTISYGINAADTIADLPHSYVSVLPQQLDEDKQKQARQNINAASQDSIIRIQEQLDAINPKVDNDVYVDMGLPSGLLWAKRNVDVTQPDGFAASEYTYNASFFSWGNVEGHNPTGTTFDYSFDAETYASTPGAKLTGNISLSYDAARAALGAPWRMPSAEEFQELFDNCDFIDANGDLIASIEPNKLITMNGVTGIRLKSKNNGGILFFPCLGEGSNTSLDNQGAFGYYWSSLLVNNAVAFFLYFNSAAIQPKGGSDRFYGFPIRPVM